MNIQKIIIILLVLVAVIGAFWLFQVETDDISNTTVAYTGNELNIQKEQDQPVKENALVKSASGNTNGASQAVEGAPKILTAADVAWLQEDSMHKIKNFQRQRGHGIIRENSDYQNYDITTLEGLANEGDFTALHMLAYRYLELGDSVNASRANFHAAVLGSTASLGSLASLAMGDYTLLKLRNEDEEKQKEALYTGLAVYETAIKYRGDRSLSAERQVLIDSENITLTDEEKAEISKRARDGYQKLAEARKAMGLGEFDNTIPAKVSKYYELFE